MIKLDIAKYCNDCPEFEADVKKDKIVAYSFSDSADSIRTDTTIRCKYAERCEAIRKHLLRNFDI